MKFKASPEAAVKFVKRFTYFAFSWPLPANATKFEKKKFDILWTLAILNCSCLLLELLYTIYKLLGNPLEFTISVCYFAIVISHIIVSIICRLRKKQFQTLIQEMEDFLKIAEPHERQVLESYVRKCFGFHCTIMIINLVCLGVVVCGPLFTIDRKFPLASVYPFSLDSRFITYFLYLHQTIAATMTNSIMGINCQSALLVWFASARIEIHSAEFKRIRDATDLRLFVEKHQHLIRFAGEAANEMSYIALVLVMGSCVAVVTSSLLLIDNYSFFVRLQSVILTVISGCSLFFFSWPADSLIEVFNGLGAAIYDSPWVDMPPKMRRNIIIILQRVQQPIVVSIGGIIPILSLRYYGCFVSAALSYFMTLRVIVNVKET